MHALERLFQKDSSIVSRRIADEVILVPIRQKLGEVNCIYTLNEAAAHIWQLIDGKRSLKSLRDSMVEAFQVQESKAQEDLIILIEQLKEVGAIQEVS
jgi:hypothetical protein